MREDASVLAHLPMPSGYFRLVFRSFGKTPELKEKILHGTGLTEDALHSSTLEINLLQQVRQVENISRLYGDDWALREPTLWNVSSHGSLGVAVLAAPDVASMIEVMTRYGFTRAPFYEMSLRRGGAHSKLQMELVVPLDESIARPMIEIAFIGIHASIARVMASPPRDFRFTFACAEPAHSERLRAILGDTVIYDADHYSVHLPSAWLEFDSPFSDPVLYRLALGELQAAVQRLSAPVNIRGRVERLLSSLPADLIGADAVARATGVSRRTLVRRLAESNVSFRELVDAELRKRARRLLDDSGLSHARIAAELGYNDPSSFSRACRRWFGKATDGAPTRP